MSVKFIIIFYCLKRNQGRKPNPSPFTATVRSMEHTVHSAACVPAVQPAFFTLTQFSRPPGHPSTDIPGASLIKTVPWWRLPPQVAGLWYSDIRTSCHRKTIILVFIRAVWMSWKSHKVRQRGDAPGAPGLMKSLQSSLPWWPWSCLWRAGRSAPQRK